ncbi:MAG: HupE/UreJ family protein, partial [bacterium]
LLGIANEDLLIDENGDLKVTVDELLVNLDEIHEYFQETVQIIVSGEPLFLQKGGSDILEDELGNVFADLEYVAQLKNRPWKLTARVTIFEEIGPKHKNLVKVITGDEVQQAILTIANNEQSFSLSGSGVSLFKQIRQFIWLGMEHIFIGYDHILFLIGLIVIGGSFMNLVKIVSSFTIAHSITLILAALQVVAIPSRVVESIIALSIVYIAVENFLIKDSDQRWLITGIFGLMHGFGFANVLTELGLPTKGLVASLLSFNVGVEIGQIAIVSFIFPVVFVISKTRWQKQLVYGLSGVILIFGLVWFLERAFGWNFPMV